MNQTLKHMFSTSAHLKAAEPIAWTYKTTIIGVLDKTHRNPEDIQRLETYVDYKKSELGEFGVVEVMARGRFHPKEDDDPRLTVHLLNAQGIPVKSVHLNTDGTERSNVDVPEHERPKMAARVTASTAAAAASAAAGAGAGGSKQ